MSPKSELESLPKYEVVYWKQKAKYKWIKDRNGNTRFFHRVASERKRKNLITKRLIDRNKVIEFEEIRSATSQYYEKLLSHEVVHRPIIEKLFEARLPLDLVASIEGSFTEEEIKLVVFSMDKDKSPERLSRMAFLCSFIRLVGSQLNWSYWRPLMNL